MRRPWYAEGAWLAVKDGDVGHLMEALALERLIDLPWSRWRTARFKLMKLNPEEVVLLKVNPKEADAERRRLVFVSPPVEGWRLLIGWRFYASSWEDVEESAGNSSHFAEVAKWCCCLRSEFGETHAFTADWENGTYAFILTRQGLVERQFVDASGDLLIDEGEPTAAELPLRSSFDPGPDDLPVCDRILGGGAVPIAKHGIASLQSPADGPGIRVEQYLVGVKAVPSLRFIGP